MIVKILKNDKELTLKAGDLYLAEIYQYDPSKVRLISKVTKKNGKRVGKDPMCTQYLYEIETQ